MNREFFEQRGSCSIQLILEVEAHDQCVDDNHYLADLIRAISQCHPPLSNDMTWRYAQHIDCASLNAGDTATVRPGAFEVIL